MISSPERPSIGTSTETPQTPSEPASRNPLQVIEGIRSKLRNFTKTEPVNNAVSGIQPKIFDEELLDQPIFLRGKMSEPTRPPGEPRTAGDFIPYREGDLPKPFQADPPIGIGADLNRPAQPIPQPEEATPMGRPTVNNVESSSPTAIPAVAEASAQDPELPKKSILEGEIIFDDDSKIPGLEQITPENRPFATKLWKGLQFSGDYLKTAGIAYWENVTHLRGRDENWYRGVAAGLIVNGALQIATAGNPAVSAAVKVGMAGAAVGANVYLDRKYIRNRMDITNRLTGDTLDAELKKLEEAHLKAKGFLENFGKGFAAASTYASVFGLGTQLVHGAAELAMKVMEHVPSLPGIPAEAVPTPAPVIPEFHANIPNVETTVPATGVGLHDIVSSTPDTAIHVSGSGAGLHEVVAPSLHTVPATGVGLHETIASSVPPIEPITPAVTEIPSVSVPTEVATTNAVVGSGVGLHDLTASAHEASTNFAPATGVGLHEAATPAPPTELHISAASNLSPEALGVRPEFSNIVAPHVGENLGMTTQAVNEALASQGIDPSSVPAETLEQARYAAQQAMEKMGNESFAKAAQELSLNGGQVDVSQLGEQGSKLFSESLASPAHHDALVQIARESLTQHMNIESQFHDAVQQVIKELPPGDAMPHLIQGGEVFSKIAQDAGHSLTYQAIPADADFVGAHVIANYDKIGNFQIQVAHAVGFGDNYHMPFSLSQAPEVIERARNGDQGAMDKLIAFLKYLPANDTITTLSDSGVNDILTKVGVTR